MAIPVESLAGNSESALEQARRILPGYKDKPTADPVSRAVMERFMGSVRSEDVGKAVRAAFLTERGLSLEFAQEVAGIISVGMLIRSPLTVGFPPRKLAMELFRLNSPTVWRHLIRGAQAEDNSTAINLSSIFPGYFDPAEGMAISNAHFFGKHTMHLGFGVVYGPAYSKVAYEYPAGTTSYSAGLSISQRFDSIAQTPDEALGRLSSLFASPSHRASPVSVLKEAKSFTRFHEQMPGSIACPGVGATMQIYSAYGELVGTPEYQEGFRAAMSASA